MCERERNAGTFLIFMHFYCGQYYAHHCIHLFSHTKKKWRKQILFWHQYQHLCTCQQAFFLHDIPMSPFISHIAIMCFFFLCNTGNNEFIQLLCSKHAPPHLYSSLTIFDIVSPSALSLLHQIFLTSLFEVVPDYVTVETKSDLGTISEHYLSLTVPCVDLGSSRREEQTYFITVRK